MPSWAFGIYAHVEASQLLIFLLLLQVAIERNYCPGLFSNPNAHAGEREFSLEQWQPPDYRGH